MIPMLAIPIYPDSRDDVKRVLDADSVKDAVRDVNPKAFLEWVALLSALAAGGMWAWKKMLKPVFENLWEIAKIGATAKLLCEGQDGIREAVAITDARTLLLVNNRADVAVWESDDKGQCTFANRRMLDALGGGFELVQGDNWNQIIWDDDRDRVSYEWSRAVETGTDFNLDYSWKKPRDGSRIPVRVTGYRVMYNGKVLHWICEAKFIF